jgi:putative glutathione S-transferase
MSGHLENGAWVRDAYTARSADGEFLRRESRFRERVSADGSSGRKAEAGRYHLYVSLACPWAHRTVIFRRLKRLEGVIGMSVVDPVIRDDGWEFSDAPGCVPDTVNGFRYLREAYLAAEPRYSGRVTVPVLWDKRDGSIVNNESSEIIRMLNSEFGALAPASEDYYPAPLRPAIDALNAQIYASVNNGVYRCGFAGSQAAYERAYASLFATLDALEQRLGTSRYLTGETITEADWRLFTTLVRFDAVYYVHFKCNLRRIAEYPNLSRLLRELCRVPGVADTVNMDHVKRHYYLSHRHLNPSGIVPAGPVLDFLGGA